MRNRPEYTDNDIDEDMKLTRGDYIKILHHYQPETRRVVSSRMSTATVKNLAHRILAEKLCRCVKSPNSVDEGRRIAYCTRSIFNKRGIRQHGFRCKTQTRRRVGNKERRVSVLRPRLTNDLTKTSKRMRI
jgi:hypothetical protein